MKTKIISLAILALFLFSIVPVSMVEAKTPKEMDEAFLAKYKTIRNKYDVATEEYKEAREDYKDLKGKISEFKNSGRGDIVFERTQDYLTKALEVMDTHNDVLISWAEFIRMDEDLRDSVLEELEFHSEKLDELKQEVGNAEDVDELISISRDVKSHWESHKVTVKKVSGILLSARAESVLSMSKNFAENLQSKLDSVESEADKAEIQALLDDVFAKIELAEAKYDQAREVYSSISDLSEANKLFNEGEDFLREGNAYIGEARDSLIEAVKLFRQTTGDEL